MAIAHALPKTTSSEHVFPMALRWSNRSVREPDMGSMRDEETAKVYYVPVDEGRKRVIGIMAAILASLHMKRADDRSQPPRDRRAPRN
jgi:hypothetical protein